MWLFQKWKLFLALGFFGRARWEISDRPPDSRESSRRFQIEAIRANRADAMKIGFFCESIGTNRFTRIARIRVANRQAIQGQ